MWFRHNGRDLEVTKGTAEHEQLVKAGAEPIVGPDGQGAAAPGDRPLASLRLPELRALAEELGVELEDGAKKAAIVEAIEAAQAGDETGDGEADLEGGTLED